MKILSSIKKILVLPHGFEPQFSVSKTDVLPIRRRERKKRPQEYSYGRFHFQIRPFEPLFQIGKNKRIKTTG